MNKEQAEIYVKDSIESLKTLTKEFQYKFLLFILALFGVAVALYQGLIFIIIIFLIAGLHIIFTIIFAPKKHYFNKTILLGIQTTVLCIALNCIIFGMYKRMNSFVVWEFLISIAIQMLSFIVSFIIIRKLTNNYKEKEENMKVKIAGGAAAGLSYSSALILCRIFVPSLEVVTTIIAILANLLVCLFSLGIVTVFYRVYLIKKYRLIIDIPVEENQKQKPNYDINDMNDPWNKQLKDRDLAFEASADEMRNLPESVNEWGEGIANTTFEASSYEIFQSETDENSDK